jgi:hypothetical protein
MNRRMAAVTPSTPITTTCPLTTPTITDRRIAGTAG